MKTQINPIIIIFLFLAFASNIFAQKAKPTPTTDQKISSSNPSNINENDDKEKAAVFFKQGQAYWKEFEISKAIEAFTKALELYPQYPEALKERGKIFFLISEYQKALPDLNAFLLIDPKNVEILYYRGLTFSALAEKIEETEVDTNPAKAFAQKALDDFNQAIGIDPTKSNLFSGRGKLLFDYENLEKAQADFEKSISLEPKNHFAYSYLGLTKYYLNNGGLAELDKAIEISPQYAEGYYNRAKYMQGKSTTDEAISNYNLAIKNSPNNPKYFTARGVLLFRTEKYRLALQDFNQAVKEDKTHGMAYFNRAMLYKFVPAMVNEDSTANTVEIIRLQYRKRLEDLSSAIKYKPNLADAYVERGLLYSTTLGSKDTPEAKEKINLALADFQMAIKINPKSAEAYNGRASCYDDLGKKDLALADYSKAIELDPKLATAYMGRMAIYCEMGKKELSIADEKKVKELGFATINVCNLK